MKKKIISLLLAGALVFSQGSLVFAAGGDDTPPENAGEVRAIASLTDVQEKERTTLSDERVQVVYTVTGTNLGAIGVKARISANGREFTPEECSIQQTGSDTEKTVTVVVPKNTDIYAANYAVQFWPTEDTSGYRAFQKTINLPAPSVDDKTKVTTITSGLPVVPNAGGNVDITITGEKLKEGTGVAFEAPDKLDITADSQEVTFSAWEVRPSKVVFTAKLPANTEEADKVYTITATPKDGGEAKSVQITVKGTNSAVEIPKSVLTGFVDVGTGKETVEITHEGGLRNLRLRGADLDNSNNGLMTSEAPNGVRISASDEAVELSGWMTSAKYVMFDAVFPENKTDQDKTYTITATPKAGGESKTVTVIVKKAENVTPEPVLLPVITKVEVDPANVEAKGGPVDFTVTGENLTKDNYTAAVKVFEDGAETSAVVVSPIKINVENNGTKGNGVMAIPENKTNKEREYRLTVTPTTEGASGQTAVVKQAKGEGTEEPIPEPAKAEIQRMQVKSGAELPAEGGSAVVNILGTDLDSREEEHTNEPDGITVSVDPSAEIAYTTKQTKVVATLRLPANEAKEDKTYTVTAVPKTGGESKQVTIVVKGKEEVTPQPVDAVITKVTADKTRVSAKGERVDFTVEGENLTTENYTREVKVFEDGVEKKDLTAKTIMISATEGMIAIPENRTEKEREYRLIVTSVKEGAEAKTVSILQDGYVEEVTTVTGVTVKSGAELPAEGGQAVLEIEGTALDSLGISHFDMPDNITIKADPSGELIPDFMTTAQKVTITFECPKNDTKEDKTYTITVAPKTGGESKQATIVVKAKEEAQVPVIRDVKTCCKEVKAEEDFIIVTAVGDHLTKDNWDAVVEVYEKDTENKVDGVSVKVERHEKPEKVIVRVPANTTGKELEYRITVALKAEGAQTFLRKVTQPKKEEEKAGWREDSVGKWYRYADGTYPKAQIAEIEGEMYYFNAQGYLECCRWVQAEGNWYYLTSESKAQKGWAGIGGSWYFFDKKTAKMQTGWIQDGDTWYFLDGSGAMRTGWVQTGGSWYFLDGSGTMKTGWLQDGGKWYLLAENGAMRIGWAKDGDTWYFLDGSGAMKTGWVQDSGNWYFLNGSGAMQTGWVQTGGSWYFLNESGAMQTGWLQQGNTWYYLKADGSMAAGIVINVGGTNYRFAGSGAWIG